ncbi:helix-turn-helix domain-containing protein [Flagellimonas sp.]|uniref:helix-turn-helix domain-containing protein n=1 Tax=Flagellimonas sp. TaxID=2058762 RepID=UPI003B500B56
MSVLGIILLCFSFQAILYAVFLFIKKRNKIKANKIWATFLLMFGLDIIHNVLYWSYKNSDITIALTYAYLIFLSLYGPLFFLYVRTLVKGKSIPWKNVAPHFIVTALVILNFGRYFVQPVAIKKRINSEAIDVENYVLISSDTVFTLLLAGLFFYTIWTFRLNRKNYMEDVEMKLWLKLTTTTFGCFTASWLIFYILLTAGVLKFSQDFVITIAMCAFIGLTSYFGFYHGSIFNGKPLKRVFPIIKYQKSGLSKSVLNDYKDKLIKLMEAEQLYLENELKLVDLAKMLSLSRHNTSQIINECFQMSFYEFVNKYRIEEAERLLVEDKTREMNITDIAFQSGFNNRISFYNAFKKHMGITPTEFRNQNIAS